MEESAGRKRAREPLLIGVVLVLIGGVLLFAREIPEFGPYIPLVVGLGLLVMFALTREYGWLIGGGVVTGVGVGVVLATSATGNLAGAGFLLSLGLGFLAIWAVSYLLRLPERHWWPLIPGLILGTIGAAVYLGGTALDLLSLWPLILVAIGIVLVARALLGTRSRA
jgi:hypothetical protein